MEEVVENSKDAISLVLPLSCEIMFTAWFG